MTPYKDYTNLISDAWEATLENKRLMWYGFFPSLFGILFGFFYTLYQYTAFKIRDEGGSFLESGFMSHIINYIFESTGRIILFAFIAGAIFIIYLVLPPICKGGLTALLARIRNGEKVRIREGLSHGLYSFLPLIEFHAITTPLSIYATIFISLNLIRNIGFENFKSFIPVIILFSIIDFILALLFTYADYFIILRRKNPFTAISDSCKLVIFHLEETFLIAILMFLIGIRVLINILVVIGIPFLILFLGSVFFITGLSQNITFFLAGFVGIVILGLASWANGLLTIFTTAVWTFTFLRAEEERKDEIIKK